jgi:F-type H+-transporting ATPase subunit a
VEIHVPLLPEVLFNLGPLSVTNTLLTSWIVTVVLLLFAFTATRNMKDVPTGIQNVAESIIELLMSLAEQVAGARARSFLPLVATLFLYILFANWIGILPGVGSFQISQEGHAKSLLRGANSDLSITAAMAIIVFFWVQISGLRTDLKSYFVKFLWPPGIGQLEIISEFSRPLSLALRLFGNILAGFILVEVMLQIAPPVIPAIFLALELGVGLIQALIFAILTLAFLSLATSHGHEGGHAEGEHAAH